MPWFFFDDGSLSWCLEGVEEAEEEELVIWESSNLSVYLVGFFLSDLMGELNRELDPSEHHFLGLISVLSGYFWVGVSDGDGNVLHQRRGLAD